MNVRDRLYYVDPLIVIAYSSRLNCPVMYHRNGTAPDKVIKRALWTSQMELTGEVDEYDGNTYYKLRRVSDG